MYDIDMNCKKCLNLKKWKQNVQSENWQTDEYIYLSVLSLRMKDKKIHYITQASIPDLPCLETGEWPFACFIYGIPWQMVQVGLYTLLMILDKSAIFSVILKDDRCV